MGSNGEILLLGGDGMLGRILRESWAQGSLLYTTRRRTKDPLALHCDFESLKGTLDLPRGGTFVLAAGITTFQGCEKDPERAWIVNVEAVGKIARHCSRHGIRLLFLSSSSIFDGMSPDPKETDAPSPMTLYGKMKKEAENLVQASRCSFQIVRLTKIMDPSTGFMQECYSRLKDGKSVKASPELPVAPLSSKWVGTALLQCLKNENEGIFHLSPIDETSYYTLAKEIGARKGEPPEKIQKQSKKSLLKNCLWLPRYAKLSAKKSSESLGLKMPKWMDALKGVK